MSSAPVEGVGSGPRPANAIIDPMKAATHPLKPDNDGDAEDRAKLAQRSTAPNVSTPVTPGSLDVKA